MLIMLFPILNVNLNKKKKRQDISIEIQQVLKNYSTEMTRKGTYIDLSDKKGEE